MFQTSAQFAFNRLVLQKIAGFTNAEKAELIAKVRSKHESNLKKELQTITLNQQQLKIRFQNSQNYKYVMACYDYSPKNTSLDKDAQEKLRKCLHYIYSKQEHDEEFEGDKTCSICTMQLEDKQQMVILNCSHHYHIQCIEKWFETKTNCPLCRDNLRKCKKDEKMMELEASIKQLNICKDAITTRNKDTMRLMEAKLFKPIQNKDKYK